MNVAGVGNIPIKTLVPTVVLARVDKIEIANQRLLHREQGPSSIEKRLIRYSRFLEQNYTATSTSIAHFPFQLIPKSPFLFFPTPATPTPFQILLPNPRSTTNTLTPLSTLISSFNAPISIIHSAAIVTSASSSVVFLAIAGLSIDIRRPRRLFAHLINSTQVILSSSSQKSSRECKYPNNPSRIISGGDGNADIVRCKSPGTTFLPPAFLNNFDCVRII